MDYVIVGLIALAVIGFVAYKHKDKILGAVKKADPTQAISEPAPTMAQPTFTTGINYAYWAQWTRFELETLQFMLHGGQPSGWDWRRHEAARGDPDGRTHTNSGTKIEAQEGRTYKAELVFRGDHGDDLLTLPGRVVVQGATVPVRLTIMHGIQSKGHVYASVDGGHHDPSPHVDLNPGDHLVLLEGEPEAKRVSVVMRPR